MSEEVARIQEVKVAFFERFWEPSGMVAVRTLAAAATEVRLIPLDFPSFFFCLLFGKVSLFAQELIPDQHSEDGRTPDAGKSPSGRGASGAPGAQV